MRSNLFSIGGRTRGQRRLSGNRRRQDWRRQESRRSLWLEPLEVRTVLTMIGPVGLAEEFGDGLTIGGATIGADVQADAALYYIAGNQQIALEVIPGEYAVKVNDADALKDLTTTIARGGFQVGELVTDGVYKISGKGLESISLDEGQIDWIVPAYRVPSTGTELYVLNEVVVTLQPGVAPADFFGDDGVSYRPLLGTPDQFVVTLDGAGQQALDYANAMSEDSRVAWASPDFYQDLERFLVPNDTLYSSQWHLNNTGSQVSDALAGADVKAQGAWDLATGAGVTIAVLDDGIERTHPDLAANIFVNPGEVPGNMFDDDGNGWIDDVNGWSFVTNGPDPSVTVNDQHGTSVAGVAAGRGNNGLGVAGSAWNAKILPVQMFNGSASVSSSGIASAIYYAAGRTANGLGTWNAAQVINCSWGGGSPSDTLTNAFTWASNTARGGAGVATFVSSGNGYSSTVSYPASLSATLPGLMAVGASNQRDLRSEYSNYGSALDFVASSSDIDAPYTVGITTTDRTGSLGYNSGDYTNNTVGNGFGGTSSASPLAAGVGALVMSFDDSLTAADVKLLLRATADKVGGVAYDANGFHVEYGYGRLNALAALEAIQFSVALTDPDNGEVVGTPPDPSSGYVVQFTHPILNSPGEIVAGGVKVNGVQAVSYTVLDEVTVQFQFSVNPVTAEGPQVLTVDAGTVRREQDGSLIGEYSSLFYYDVLPLAVTSTSPAIGSTITLPLASLVVNFNEPFLAASVGVEDFSVSQGSVTGVETVDVDTVRLTFSGIAAEGDFSLGMAFGAMTDVHGSPSIAFDGQYVLDVGTVPFPSPLTRVAPLGSLIYQGTHSGVLAPGGDADIFTLDMDPSQAITIAVTPTSGSALQPKITLVKPSGASVSAEAAAAGQIALLQSVMTEAVVGTYQLIVEGANGTTVGDYRIEVTLNAAQEVESNNTQATAQDLDALFVGLSSADSRAAVLGTGQTQYVTDGFESGNFNTLPWVRSGDVNWYVTTDSSASGTRSARAGTIGDNQKSQLSLTTTTVAGEISFARRVGSEVNFDYLDFLIDGQLVSYWSGNVPFATDSFAVSEGTHTFTWLYWKDASLNVAPDTAYLDDVRIPVAYETDYYRFSLNQGESATIAVTGRTDLSNSFELRDAANNLLATSVAGATSADQIIADFTSTSPGTAVYYVVARPNVDYSLLVTKNAAFDRDANNSPAAAQPLVVSQDVVGYLGGEISRVTEGFETGNFSQLPWTSVGNQSWSVTTQAPAAGSYSANAGVITHDQTTGLSLTTATGDGFMQFDRRVSSEAGYDGLRFFIDGTQVGGWSGIETMFTHESFPVTAGNHTFLWSYTKDYSLDEGLDTAFVDNVTFVTPATIVDWYAVTMEAGKTMLSVRSSTPGDGAGQFANELNAKLELYDSTGTVLLASGGVLADGRNEQLAVDGLTPGMQYRIKVTAETETTGEYFLQVDQPVLGVVDRHLVYNASVWDGNNAAANQDDDDAVATDKQPLLPDQLATLQNYSTYSRGINGLMVDVAGLGNPSGLSAADFEFRVGNTNDPLSWSLLGLDASQITVAVRLGAGSLGSDRVTILFPDGVIQNTWLQVTVKANATTGLAAPDVHYWGHMIGETGDVAGDTLVDGYDVAGVIANPHTVGDPALITDVYDFNRDRLVDAVDVALARAYATTPTTMLRMLDLRIAGLPEITISVSPGSVTEDGAANLVYTFTRSGSTTAATTIAFRVTGSAVVADDYMVSGAASYDAKVGTVTFAAGSSTATVTIDPTADTKVELDETAWLSVLPDASNQVGAPSHVSGAITRDDTLQVSQTVIQEGTTQRSIITNMKVAFNAEVAIAPGAFQIINRGTGQALNFSVTTTVVDGKTTATLAFLAGNSVYARQAEFALNDGNYQLTIDATKVTYLGLQLDGNRNGTAGDNFVFGAAAADKFFRYFGDMDGDRDVDATDYGRLGLTYRKIAGQSGFNKFLDYDGDGDVDATDYGRFSLRYRKVLAF